MCLSYLCWVLLGYMLCAFDLGLRLVVFWLLFFVVWFGSLSWFGFWFGFVVLWLVWARLWFALLVLVVLIVAFGVALLLLIVRFFGWLYSGSWFLFCCTVWFDSAGFYFPKQLQGWYTVLVLCFSGDLVVSSVWAVFWGYLIVPTCFQFCDFYVLSFCCLVLCFIVLLSFVVRFRLLVTLRVVLRLWATWPF